MNISTIRKAYREMYVDLSQDTVDLVSTGRKSLVLTKASLSILISRSREIETINSTIIILLFPSSIRMSNQSIVNQNDIKNEDLVSTVHFRVQSTVSWKRSTSMMCLDLEKKTK